MTSVPEQVPIMTGTPTDNSDRIASSSTRRLGVDRIDRNKRIPLGGISLKLQATQRPGFTLRYVNDDGARISDALQAGWMFVPRDDATPDDGQAGSVFRDVGAAKGGGVQRAYLMDIPTEWYEADQAAKAAAIDAKESAIKQGAIPGEADSLHTEGGGASRSRERIRFDTSVGRPSRT